MGKVKTQPRKSAAGKSATDKKHKVIPPKKLIDAHKAPDLRRSTRRLEKMPEAAYRAAIDLGNRQPTINMHGGVGIPGPRTKAAVTKLTRLDFAKLDTELPAILKMSQQVRGNKNITAVRKKVKPVNRQVVYREGASDVHSLHVANDIAAVSNSRTSKVYDYPDLAPKLDKRLQSNGKAKGKTYFDSKIKAADRRSRGARDVARPVPRPVVDHEHGGLEPAHAGRDPRQDRADVVLLVVGGKDDRHALPLPHAGRRPLWRARQAGAASSAHRL